MALKKSHKPRPPRPADPGTRSRGRPRSTRGVGRPTFYKPEFPELARLHCLKGATNQQLGEAFSVDAATISDWLAAKPEFRAAVDAGRERADAEVANALFLRATGKVTIPAVKIYADAKSGAEHVVEYTEHFPPDTAAAIHWLKCRQPALWADRSQVDVTSNSADTKTLKLELSPRALAHVEELAKLLLGDDDEDPNTTEGVLIEHQPAKGNGEDHDGE